MKTKPVMLAAALVLTAGAGAASAVEVHQMLTVKGAPDAVWQKIGDFCAIKDWHPRGEGLCRQRRGRRDVSAR